MAAILDREAEFFERHRALWLAEGHAGKFAVIRGEILLGFFASFAQGYNAGAGKWGAQPFMVKEVSAAERVEHIQRVHW